MSLLPALRRTADALIGATAVVGTLGLLVEVGVILVDVVGRAFGAPLTGAQDVSTMTMAILVFGGMALCDRVGGHVAVDVLEPALPRRFVRVTDVLWALVGAAIFAGIAWTVWRSAQLSQMLHLATNIIGLPKAWFQIAMAGLSVVAALGMLLRAAELALSGRDVRAERLGAHAPGGDL